MASSSPNQSGSPTAQAGPSQPRSSNPWATTTSRTPSSKPAWGFTSSSSSSSSSTSAGFPALSPATPSRKRDRGSPWKPTPRQSYPSRLHEIQARALARRAVEDEALLLEEASGGKGATIKTLQDLESAAAAGEEQGEDADFYRGPVQMYGMSRVTVCDLSEATAQGKGKNKVRGRGSTVGPQVYARHNAPWVQRAKRGREEGGGVADDVEVASRPEHESVEATPVVFTSTTTSSLEEVVAAYHRATRIQAAQRRSGTSSSAPPTDLLAPLLEKLQYDVENGAPLTSIRATLTSVPQGAAERCLAAAASSITKSAPRQPPAALWQLLRLCLDLELDEESDEGRPAWQATLCTLNAHGADAQPTDMSDEEARALVTRLLVPLDALVAQQNRSLNPAAPSVLFSHLARALHLIRLAHPRLPSATFYARSLSDPRALDLLKSLDDDDGSSYAFLFPLSSTKLRLVSREAERVAEQARRERLWGSFYSPAGEDRNAPPRLRVRRTHVLEDTLDALHQKESSIWQHGAHFMVEFSGEEGVDGVLGGLRREWLSLLVAELVREGVVREAEDEGSAGVVVLAEGTSVDHAKLFGLVVGMNLLLGVPCGFRPDRATMRCLLSEDGEPPDHEKHALDDLEEAYPTLARNLRAMLDWQPSPNDADGDATFQRTFSLNWTAVDHPGALPRPLVSGGQHRPVTLANRHAYARTLAQHRLYGSARSQLEAARAGFSMAWPPRSRAWLRGWLAEEELVSLIEGPTRVDVRTLRRTVQVVKARRGGEDESLLATWWEAVERLQREDEDFSSRLLAFVTASPRLPLSFLSAANGEREVRRLPAPFAIHLVDEESSLASSGSSPLPWASTCTMTLFLPRGYAKVGVDEMVERMKRSVELGVEGFGLK